MLSNPLSNVGEEQSSQKFMSVTAEGNVFYSLLFVVIWTYNYHSIHVFLLQPLVNVHIVFYKAWQPAESNNNPFSSP